MKIDIEYFELMQRQYAELFAEQMRAIKALAAELHEINAMYRELRASSAPAQTEAHEDELRRERAIAFARAVQRDETAKVN
jgi:hypothetical protein